MKKLGIIGAMDIEVETLKEYIANPVISRYAGMEFCAGLLEGCSAVVVRCGVGKVNAALCVQILCNCFGITHLINTGIAGSLCKELDIGDLVISKDAMYHDFNCNVFGYPNGQVPGMPLTYQADEELIMQAFSVAEQVNPGRNRIGRIASGDQFICEELQKEQIISVTGGLCTEMEGAGIAQAAYRNEIPFVIVRAISDKADHSAEMDYPTFEKIAAHRCAAVVRKLAAELKQNAGF